ncbi:MAG TPA: hypothetical protein PK188_05840, partial [Thermosynergistes sp.]|nr:hypothetical protein [Thermosynergistes sp.]
KGPRMRRTRLRETAAKRETHLRLGRVVQTKKILNLSNPMLLKREHGIGEAGELRWPYLTSSGKN